MRLDQRGRYLIQGVSKKGLGCRERSEGQKERKELEFPLGE